MNYIQLYFELPTDFIRSHLKNTKNEDVSSSEVEKYSENKAFMDLDFARSDKLVIFEMASSVLKFR